MQYFTRLIYTLIIIIICIPALSSVFIFFELELEVYGSYLMWMAAVAIFSSILAPNNEDPKLINLLKNLKPNSSVLIPTVLIPTVSIPTISIAPVASKSGNINSNDNGNMGTSVGKFFSTLFKIGKIDEPVPLAHVESNLSGNTTNNDSMFKPTKKFFSSLFSIFKSDDNKK